VTSKAKLLVGSRVVFQRALECPLAIPKRLFPKGVKAYGVIGYLQSYFNKVMLKKYNILKMTENATLRAYR
jgi:hypothetical protein